MFDKQLTAKVWATVPVFAKHQPTAKARLTLRGLAGEEDFQEYAGLVAVAERGKGSAANIQIPEAEAGCKVKMTAQLEDAKTSQHTIKDAEVTKLKLAGGVEGPEFTLAVEFTASQETIVWLWTHRRATCKVELAQVQTRLEV